MITRFAKLACRLSVALTILLTIAACGGGGGGGGFLPDDDPNTYFVEIFIYDENGNPTETVTSTSPVRIEITVTRNTRRGDPVADVVVDLSTDIGQVSPASGTALTNEQGLAVLQLLAGADLGAGTVQVTVDGPSGPVTATINFQVGRADLRLGHFDLAAFIDGEIGLNATSLPSGGSALLSLAVVDEDNNAVASVETITLNSPCAQSGLATLPASVETVNGQATATYTATGCDGSDQITATLVGGGDQAVGTLTVATPTVNSINFISAEPTNIALKGTGGAGRQETSTVTFQAVDGGGNPLTGIEVNFGLSTDVGGMTLANATAFTDATGEAQTVVRAGDVATTVRVQATIESEDDSGNPITLTNISDVLVVSTGLPDQNSISLSAATLKVAGAKETDGVQVTITVRMGDGFNNPVPDGTTALFTTEYGIIQPSCVTVDGSCSVFWRSQSPRFPDFFGAPGNEVRTIFESGYSCPSHNGSSGPCPDDLGYTRGLRSTILVTAIGQETFVDANANGVYDQGELFINLPEAFLDNNEDGFWTPGIASCFNTSASSSLQCKAGVEEEFADFDVDSNYDFNASPARYNGLLCPVAAEAAGSCSRELVHVRDDLVLTLASTSNFFALLAQNGSTVATESFEGNSYLIYISDEFNNSPASGTTVSLGAAGVEDPRGDCEVIGDTSFVVPVGGAPGAFAIPVQTKGVGTLTVTVNNFDQVFPCTAPEPEPDPDPDPDPGGGGGGLVLGP